MNLQKAAVQPIATQPASRKARGGPKYRLVPLVFALLVAVSAAAGWLLFQAVGS